MSAPDERAPGQPQGNLGSLEVTNALGMKLLLPIASIKDAYERMRYMGARGWSTGPVPAGGFILPFSMSDVFDFSLIGGRYFEYVKDGETKRCVEHRGFIYTRRDYAARTTGAIRMPAKVKYSRGAKPTDEDHVKEGGEGDKAGYVTLIQFVGNGDRIPEFCMPPARAERPQTQERAPAAAATGQTTTAAIDHLLSAVPLQVGQRIRALAKWANLTDAQLAVYIGFFSGRDPLSIDDVDALTAKIKKERAA